jgi:hypothetical protein
MVSNYDAIPLFLTVVWCFSLLIDLAAQVRDAQMITQHAFLGETTYQNAGAIFFGSASSPGYL